MPFIQIDGADCPSHFVHCTDAKTHEQQLTASRVQMDWISNQPTVYIDTTLLDNCQRNYAFNQCGLGSLQLNTFNK